MKLRPYRFGEDCSLIEDWITDERTHALWCAGRFPWPPDRERFELKLKPLAEKGDCPLLALTEEGEPVGFVCCSPGPAAGESKLKFVVVAPGQRGRGYGREMVRLAADYAAERQNAETVRLSVFAENTAALHCYERAGFTVEKTEERAFPFREECWGRCEMALRLPDCDET